MKTKVRDVIVQNVKRLALPFLGVVIAAGFYLAMREKPLLVDLDVIKTGPMQVTIEEEGETRVRDIYVVSSPIAGHLDRTTLDEGSPVEANKTIIASIHPLDPPFLDERRMTELKAHVEAAKSAVALAEVEHQRAKIALKLAESEHQRAIKLFAKKVISSSHLEKAENEALIRKALVESTMAQVRVRKAELLSAEARLTQPTDVADNHKSKTCCINLYSPVDGVVLTVHARSKQTVLPGAKIAEVGDRKNLEVIVDLLSSDAPKVRSNSRVLISDWGGGVDLEAKVERIEPAAFTKVSSLGIEEQRVNAVLNLEKVPDNLGHGYRVLANFIIWSAENVIQVPIGALFRTRGQWSVFVVVEGEAQLRQVKIGQMNSHSAEIISGVKKDDEVVLYPNDQLKHGRRVVAR